tara:strand:+ start:1279 stop:1995 length:717 start_codon:yes stop_codon:yes gene_type:complete
MLKLVYKPVGLTPYELVKNVRKRYPKYKKIAFAGRLDPMAHGYMLLLIDEHCKLMDNYLNLEKSYEYQIIFGITTNTYDIMGNILCETEKIYNLEYILEKKNYLVGEYFQKYPQYSSKTVLYNNKMIPMWKIKDLNQIKIPKKRIKVKYIKYIDHYYLNKRKLVSLVSSRLNQVKSSNFNIKSFKSQWENIKENDYLIVKFKSHVTSGTYIREISNQLGILTNYGGTILEIYRNKIYY